MGSKELYHIRIVLTSGSQTGGVVMRVELRVESVDGVYTQALSMYSCGHGSRVGAMAMTRPLHLIMYRVRGDLLNLSVPRW